MNGVGVITTLAVQPVPRTGRGSRPEGAISNHIPRIAHLDTDRVLNLNDRLRPLLSRSGNCFDPAGTAARKGHFVHVSRDWGPQRWLVGLAH